MADLLSASDWNGFTRKHGLALDDERLVKALVRFDRTDGGQPALRLEALDEVAEQAQKQVVAQARRRKELGDRLFGTVKDALYDLLDAAEKLQKDLRRAIEQAEADAAEKALPALLGSKLIPLIRELRKGTLSMPVLIATTGRETLVLLSRRAISPARGKLLKDQLASPSGLKFIRGNCRYENNALVFVVQSQAGGLARRLKAALLRQTALRLNVVVRQDDEET